MPEKAQKKGTEVKAKDKARIDREKRSFMKKFGKYAAVGAGATVLMRPSDALAESNQDGGVP